MADVESWTEVTAADGTVAGWMTPPDPDEPDVDYFAADRVPRAGRRAAALYEAAALFDSVFTPDEVREMWQASGLSGDELDSAANTAMVLWEIEQQRR
jgi:hypothetical protein